MSGKISSTGKLIIPGIVLCKCGYSASLTEIACTELATGCLHYTVRKVAHLYMVLGKIGCKWQVMLKDMEGVEYGYRLVQGTRIGLRIRNVDTLLEILQVI